LRLVSDARMRADVERKPMSGSIQWTASRIREPTGPAVSPRMSTNELLELAITPGASRQVKKVLQMRSGETTLGALRRAATTGTPEQRMVAPPILGDHGCQWVVKRLVTRVEAAPPGGVRAAGVPRWDLAEADFFEELVDLAGERRVALIAEIRAEAKPVLPRRGRSSCWSAGPRCHAPIG
jgi:hypothetical protein